MRAIGGSHLSHIFWEHENLSSLSTLNYTRKRKKDIGKNLGYAGILLNNCMV